MRRTVAAVTAMAAVLMAGCGPQTAVSPTPSPSPTFMCTPEAGGSEAPCSEQDYQKMKAKDVLYAEAEQVYRTYRAELLKALKKGGASSLPAGMSNLVGNTEVSDGIVAYLRFFKKYGLRIAGDGSTVEAVKRLPSITKRGSRVTIAFCVDGRHVAIYQGSKKVKSEGAVNMETVYFGGDPIKMVSVNTQKVDACEG